MEYKPQKRLLGINNTKMLKSIELGYLTAILHLAPHKLSGVNICPKASVGCAMACLNTSGRGRFKFTQDSRLNKTYYFLKDRQKFLLQLDNEIKNFKKRAIKKGLKPAVRLNGTSDINFEKLLNRYLNINFAQFVGLKFYDYTKDKNKALEYSTNQKREKYRITYSRSENDSERDIQNLLTNGVNVAIVFAKNLPGEYLGFPVINGDLTDLRFNDQLGVIIGLKAKGEGKKDKSGFVIQYQ